MKAILVTVSDDDVAYEVARLLAACLTLNGYDAGPPTVLDWPIKAKVRFR